MTTRPIITDEQLRDLRDGLLTGAEKRLVEIQSEIDGEVAERLAVIRGELSGLRLAEPSSLFSKNIMAQLAAEGLVGEPAAARRADWRIGAFLGVLGLLFAASLFFLWKNWAGVAPSVELPAVRFYVNWGQILNSPAFRWLAWAGCLVPAALLLNRQLEEEGGLIFGKTRLS